MIRGQKVSARLGRNKQRTLRRMGSLHAAQCPLVIALCQTSRSHGRAAAITPSSALSPQSSVPQSSENGFSLISAIFLLVVIAALGTFAVTLSTIQQQSSALDVMGARAYQAARAGIEWGAFQVLRNSSCAATTTLAALPGTLADYTVTVTCASTATTEAGVAVTMFQLTSNAMQGAPATASYVERQMTVTIAR